MAEMFTKLTREEIQDQIPYELICTVRETSVWNTSRRRRRYAAAFSEAERAACTRLFRNAHTWYLVTGVPDHVMMSMDTYQLWQKLGTFCALL